MKVFETNRSLGLGNLANILITINNGKIQEIKEYLNYCPPVTYKDPEIETSLEIFKKMLQLDPNSLIKVLYSVSDKTLKEEGKKLLYSFIKKMEEDVNVI